MTKLAINELFIPIEQTCFELAVKRERSFLWRQIFALTPTLMRLLSVRLNWHMHPLLSAMQLFLLIFLIPLLGLYQIFLIVFRGIFFPFCYMKTCFHPSGLAAPGEKNITGMHNAFSRYFRFNLENHVGCIDDWVQVLYGSKLQQGYSLSRELNNEKDRLLNLGGRWDPYLDDQGHLKNFVNHRREQLSRRLGHYLNSSANRRS